MYLINKIITWIWMKRNKKKYWTQEEIINTNFLIIHEYSFILNKSLLCLCGNNLFLFLYGFKWGILNTFFIFLLFKRLTLFILFLLNGFLLRLRILFLLFLLLSLRLLLFFGFLLLFPFYLLIRFLCLCLWRLWLHIIWISTIRTFLIYLSIKLYYLECIMIPN